MLGRFVAASIAESPTGRGLPINNFQEIATNHHFSKLLTQIADQTECNRPNFGALVVNVDVDDREMGNRTLPSFVKKHTHKHTPGPSFCKCCFPQSLSMSIRSWSLPMVFFCFPVVVSPNRSSSKLSPLSGMVITASTCATQSAKAYLSSSREKVRTRVRQLDWVTVS